MRELSLEEVKQAELNILKEFDRVCRELGLHYCLAYGSCIGAVRHNGFIPWDDDIDVHMTREDYEQLYLHFAQTCKNPHYQLLSYRNQSSVSPYFKITDTTTKVVEEHLDEKYWTGVWIDVFPLDKAPKPGRKFTKNQYLLYLRYLSVSNGSTGKTPAIRLAKKIACPIIKAISSPYAWAKKVDDYARTCGSDDNAYCTMNPPCIYTKEQMTPIEHQFEDFISFIPKGYDEYLTEYYGDWRTPVPPEEREAHATSVFKLD